MDCFPSIKVVNVDGSHELELTNVPKEQKLDRFKAVLAMRLGHSLKRNVRAQDFELFFFGERMVDESKNYSVGAAPNPCRANQHAAHTLLDLGITDVRFQPTMKPRRISFSSSFYFLFPNTCMLANFLHFEWPRTQ